MSQEDYSPQTSDSNYQQGSHTFYNQHQPIYYQHPAAYSTLQNMQYPGYMYPQQDPGYTYYNYNAAPQACQGQAYHEGHSAQLVPATVIPNSYQQTPNSAPQDRRGHSYGRTRASPRQQQRGGYSSSYHRSEQLESEREYVGRGGRDFNPRRGKDAGGNRGRRGQGYRQTGYGYRDYSNRNTSNTEGSKENRIPEMDNKVQDNTKLRSKHGQDKVYNTKQSEYRESPAEINSDGYVKNKEQYKELDRPRPAHGRFRSDRPFYSAQERNRPNVRQQVTNTDKSGGGMETLEDTIDSFLLSDTGDKHQTGIKKGNNSERDTVGAMSHRGRVQNMTDRNRPYSPKTGGRGRKYEQQFQLLTMKDDTDVSRQKEPDLRNSLGSYNNRPPEGIRAQSGFQGRGKVIQRQISHKVDETQRGLLIEQLTQGTYECMVCCDAVRGPHPVWSCSNCYHVFHLRCIKKWARSPAATVEGAESGWRCPACQNLADKFPHNYFCFCGKIREPEWNRMETPHSCGEVCGKSRGNDCPHLCTSLCHPGPCPPCGALVKKSCDCGKTSQSVKCGQSVQLKCEQPCGRMLNCGRHECQGKCHSGGCVMCEETVKQVCHCGQSERVVLCGSEESYDESFTCKNICDRFLNCKKHNCGDLCHPGNCKPCQRLPSLVTHCPCGSSLLAVLSRSPRTSCTDPIPACGKMCNKPLSCGPEDNHHLCQKMCHEGACGPCEGVTMVTCRCGAIEKEFLCLEAEAFTEEKPYCCDKRCNKKRSCGRHKCGQTCCLNTEHPCDLICGKKLPCGLHKCDELCHRGNCPPCLMASFEELICHCGGEVMYPPVPCGTEPPECHRTCQRRHACDHPVRHNCHSDEQCPPCTQLTEKMCMGGHELRKNIPCYLVDISCGLPCNKSLPCELHKCQRVCHKGSCLCDGEACSQPCPKKREECAHPCGVPCHSGQSCPVLPCKAQVLIKCACGNKTSRVLCLAGSTVPAEISDYQKMNLASSLVQNLSSGQSVDISRFSGQKRLKQLECDESCAIIERNRRVALALEISNPDLNAKLGNPTYTDFLKEYAKNNLSFVANLDKVLSDLVQSAKQSKQPYRSHAFPAGNRDQRRVEHELAEFYGCETQAYDYEPNKNVVATAHKDKCWLPSVTLTALIQRELHPKAPPPIPHVHKEPLRQATQSPKQSAEDWTEVKGSKHGEKKKLLSMNSVLDTFKTPKEQTSGAKTDAVVDYFDFSTPPSGKQTSKKPMKTERTFDYFDYTED